MGGEGFGGSAREARGGCYGGHAVSGESLKVLHPHAILELELGHQCGCVRFHTYKHDILPIKCVALRDSGIIVLRDGVSVRMYSLPHLRTPENTRSARRTYKSHKYFGGCSCVLTLRFLFRSFSCMVNY